MDGPYKDPDTGIYEMADPYPAIGVSSGLKSAALRTGTKPKLQVDTLYIKATLEKEIEEKLVNKQDKATVESLGLL